MSRRRKISRRAEAVIGCALVALLGAALLIGLALENHRTAQLREKARQASAHNRDAVVYRNGEAYTPRRDLQTILLIGTDSDSGTAQCDFVTLMIVDAANSSWKLLQLNRDTMCSVAQLTPQGGYQHSTVQQLALAHAYGSGGMDSCRNVVRSVENLLYGVNIQGFLRIPVGAVGQLNDCVDGVTVTIEDDFSAMDAQMVPGASLRLDGAQAERFVRARKGMEDATNQNRMHRQQVYLLAWLEQAQPLLAEEGGAAKLLQALPEEMLSDLSVQSIQHLAEKISTYPAPEVLTPAGETVAGAEFAEFYPDEAALQQQILELFYLPVKE